MAGDSLATVVMVPGERFSLLPRALDAILQRTKRPFELLVVDAASPRRTREFLRRQSQLHDFRILRTWRHVVPNRARNLALRYVRTPYVAFVDYDTLVGDDWLTPLLECGQQTGAAAVGPLYCRHEPEGRVIHMAGGTARVLGKPGERQLVEDFFLCGKLVEQVRDQLCTEATELLEFHCLLLRCSSLRGLGPLDEQLKSTADNIDLCLQLRASGEQVMLEPSSLATYVPPPPLEPHDLPLYQRRWSTAWSECTLRRLREKWQLSPRDPGLTYLAHWLDSRRCTLPPLRRTWRRIAQTPGRLLQWVLGPPLEQPFG